MKRFILFDHDGVLVETEPWFYAANVRALDELGIRFSKDHYLALMADGISCWSLVDGRRIAAADVTAARTRRNQYYQAYLRSEDIEIPGVLETLEMLAAEYQMGIVTTSKQEDFDLIHAERSILDWMAFALTQDAYKGKKPLPDPYLAGLEKFAATAEQTVVVEDSARGLKSAIAAGIDCIIVDNAFTRGQDFGGAKLVIKQLAELPQAIASLAGQSATD